MKRFGVRVCFSATDVCLALDIFLLLFVFVFFFFVVPAQRAQWR